MAAGRINGYHSLNRKLAEGSMNTIDLNSVADIVFQLRWSCQIATHNECYAARGINLWRDWLPESIRQALMGRQPWEQISVDFSAGELFGTNGGPVTIERNRFTGDPKRGRFYPLGRLSGLPGVFPQNMQPFRCVDIDNGNMAVDLAHPLALRPLSLSMTAGAVTTKAEERGGSSVDWIGVLTDGPGMQSRWQGIPTDFFSNHPFYRRDDLADAQFYSHPRLVHHLDETARGMVTDLYSRFVKDGMHVLDLMSSWVSHLPKEVKPAGVSGLGMNRVELEQNPWLTEINVHDLNADPSLPYGRARFDVVVCTVSIEYLIRPLDVFAEVARVLKPGGTFVITFSNRWFPPKVVRIWEQIHEFERVGLVLEYFLRSGNFENPETYSMRGLPRPRDDKYAGELALSDPVYAVWATRIGKS
jgi:SAM-dependent methyltransferase